MIMIKFFKPHLCHLFEVNFRECFVKQLNIIEYLQICIELKRFLLVLHNSWSQSHAHTQVLCSELQLHICMLQFVSK